jgi:GDP-L-fucose synthase
MAKEEFKEPGKIFVAGHRGMVGSALVRCLEQAGEGQLLTRTRSQLDLTRQQEVESFFVDEKINTVYLAAARVGGIKANNEYPADFIRQNLQIQTNVIEAAFQAGVSRLLFLGSSCIYPRLASKCANHTGVSMVVISEAPCQPTCTDPTTILIWKPAMSCRRY